MATAQELHKVIRLMTRRTGSPRFSLEQLQAFTKRAVARFREENPAIAELLDNELLILGLTTLAGKDVLRLDMQNGQVSYGYYAWHYQDMVRRELQALSDHPDYPFPNEGSLKIDIPSTDVTPVDVTQTLVSVLQAERKSPVLLRLMFPDGLPSMLVPSDLLSGPLVDLCIQKVRRYLRQGKNAAYVQQKLAPVFGGRTGPIEDVVNQVLTNPSQAAQGIREPTEFTLSLWTHLTNLINREYAEKKERLPEEQAIAQACYLLSYYVVFFKGIAQREKDESAAIQLVAESLKNPPYAFTMAEIMNLKDPQGVPLTKRLDRDQIRLLVEEKASSPDGKGLPEVIRVVTPEKREYFVQKDFIHNLVLDALFNSRKELAKQIPGEWAAFMRDFQKTRVMTEDEAFRRYVASWFKERYPLPFSLLKFEMLFLIREEVKMSDNARSEISELLDTRLQEIRPMDEVLGMDRKKLLADARLLLPVWMSIPILRGIIRLLTGRGRKGGDSAEAASSDATPGSRSERQQQAAFRAHVKRLQKEFLPSGSTMAQSLSDLAERWNPLLDPVAKANLVEDVNALVRDFVRSRRAALQKRPPSAERVRDMAHQLAEKDTFSRVRRREDLQRYIELYLLKLMGIAGKG